MLTTDQKDSLGILSSTRYVVENAQHVTLAPGAVQRIARRVEERILEGMPRGEEAFGTFASLEEAAQFAFFVDSANFCFWAEQGRPKWQVEWPQGQHVGGGFGLNAVFQRALAEKVPVLEAEYLAGLTLEQTRELFRSSSEAEIPLLEHRHKNLQEAGRVLLQKYQGRFLNLVEDAGFDAVEIIRRVSEDFSSYRDVAAYDGREVIFLKRAQICVHDLSLFQGSPIIHIDRLTAFADYKLPQILREAGVIQYAPGLAEKVDRYVLIPAGSKEEVEIRAATVWGVELIRQALGKYPAGVIDNAIWYISQDQVGLRPYHRTYTIFY